MAGVYDISPSPVCCEIDVFRNSPVSLPPFPTRRQQDSSDSSVSFCFAPEDRGELGHVLPGAVPLPKISPGCDASSPPSYRSSLILLFPGTVGVFFRVAWRIHRPPARSLLSARPGLLLIYSASAPLG